MVLQSDVATPAETCGRAMNLQVAGHLDRAAQLYREVLKVEPSHALANHCLGMLSVQLRRPADGLPFLLAALNEHPENSDYWLGYLEGLFQAGELDAAQEALALGRQHGLSGQALERFTARLLAATRARREQADALQRMIEHERFADGLILARAMTERYPTDGLSWKRLGALSWWQGFSDEAFTAMQNSVRFLQRDAEANSNFGMALLRRKRYDQAMRYLERAIEIDPRFAAAHYHLGLAQLHEHRFAESEASLRLAVTLRPDYLTAEVEPVHSDLLFVTSHNPAVDADTLFAEHRRFGKLLETPTGELRHRRPHAAESKCPLRIGFVSGDLRDHSVALFLEPVLRFLRHRPDLELHAYSTRASEDAVTQRLRAIFHHWHPICALTDAAAAKKISGDGIDILIDLSGHTAGNRLRAFARKPAPVQASWLGYPGTTGLRAMDYYFADRRWLPPGQFDRLFTEKLVYLPDRWAFDPPANAPEVGALPALGAGHLTFGSFHRMSKLSTATIRSWSQLLLALPQATLLLAGIDVDHQRILAERFAAHGVQSGRLMFHGNCRMDRYLALHRQVDIALDAYPYGGGTTTMYSLFMGVPTLTLAGATSASRAGAGILEQRGLDGFVAANPAEFVAKGRYWAAHLSELAQLRAGLRVRLSRAPGGQPGLIAAHLARALRHIWRRWCAGLPAESFHSSLRSGAPDDAALLALVAQHRFAEALEQARIMTEDFPERGLGWKILGALLWAEGRSDEALIAMQASTRLLPHDPEVHSNLGISFAALQRFDEAETWLRKALAIDPGFGPAHYRLGMYYELQSRYEEAEASLRTATSLRTGPLTTDDEQGYSNLMYVISHNASIDAQALFAEHCRVGGLFEADVRAIWPRHSNARDPGRRLRIGFVSADFRDHSVATFLEPVLRRLIHSPRLELHAYSNHAAEDRVTGRLRRCFAHWHAISALTDIDLARRIAADGIDILIDLGGHTAHNRLRTFARKPAPIQASWLGYPGTTGLHAMDYYIADSCWLPPGEFDWSFTEKLAYLPDRWAFEPHADAPAVNALPALDRGYLTFGSFHRPGKVNAFTMRLWSKLLLDLPQAKLLIAGISLPAQESVLLQGFGVHGVSPERLRFHGRCTMDAYLAFHHQVDIALDTLPFSGATTTMHSLSMGVPTLTVAGSTSWARACAGIMKHVALDGFIATNAADFAARAAYWSVHLNELAEVRAGLRARLSGSPGGQPDLIAAHLEKALRHMWQRWCAGLPAERFHSTAVVDAARVHDASMVQ